MGKAEINFYDAIKDLNRINTKKLPLASALACNDTAFKAKEITAKNMPKKFDLKSPWIQKGVRVQKASKSEAVIKATVYHLDSYLEDQEDGGERKPTSGQSTMPVKTKKFRGRTAKVQRKKYASSLIAQYDGPSAAGKQGGHGKKKTGTTQWFSYRRADGSGFIARRQNRAKKNNHKFVFAYYYIKEADYKPRMDFKKTVVGVAKNIGPAMLKKQIDRLS